jgi:hypothetical protein
MAYRDRRFWRLLASVDSAGRTREHFTERDLFPCQVFWTQFVQVSTDKPAKQCGSYVVRMAF